ncbi:hypothetical protein, partial [Hungatella effluvii]|uniref:hypothetical protein n=1 Tax=Hungatella effluvii TaxID=1096246 RepID=UPI002A811A3E
KHIKIFFKKFLTYHQNAIPPQPNIRPTPMESYVQASSLPDALPLPDIPASLPGYQTHEDLSSNRSILFSFHFDAANGCIFSGRRSPP